jgi:hypothetical protein
MALLFMVTSLNGAVNTNGTKENHSFENRTPHDGMPVSEYHQSQPWQR